MKVSKPLPNHCDNRGSIKDILYNKQVDHVTMIEIKSGSIRGNHFHKETIQYIYVLEGSILYRTKLPNGEIVDNILDSGDLMLTEVNEAHAMQAKSDSKFMVFTKGPRGGADYESDTYRLDAPIL